MEISDILKYLNGTKKPKGRLDKELKTWRDVYYAMSLHTTGTCPKFYINGAYIEPPGYICEQYQWLFDYRLMNRHPSESPESRNYRYSIYRPLTKEPLLRAIGVVGGAIFQDSNYSIDLKDKDDAAYINSNSFQGYDLIGYFNGIGLHHIAEDPNGYTLRMPSKPYYEQTGKKIEVGIWNVGSKDIVYMDDDTFIFKDCLTDYGYYIDTETIWRFTLNEKGKYELSPEDSEGYYAHLLGYLPLTKNGGEWNTKGHFDSYFDPAKALLDEFISTFSGAQAVDKEASHPFIVAAQEDCPSCDGAGQISVCGTCKMEKDSCRCENTDYNSFVLATCGKCNGSKQVAKNPMQWIRVPKDELKDKVEHIKYVNPDISINKHHREVLKGLTEDIMKSLHLYRADVTQSGEAKKVDQEGLYQFLTRVSNHMFDKVIYDTLRDIIALRNVNANGGVVSPAVYPFTIVKPTQFRIKSEADLLDEYIKGQTGNLPITLRQKQATEYADKAFSGDEVEKKKVRVTNMSDALALLIVADKLSLRVAGAITQEDLVFSTQLPIYINELIEEKGEQWFVDTEISKVVEELQKKKVILPAVTPNQPVIVDNNGLQQNTPTP